LSNVVILAIALVIMANLRSIQTAWYVTLLFGAGTGAVLVLRWVWERINLYSEVSAIIVSLIFAPIILFTVKAEWLRLLLMSSISTIIVITTTLMTSPTSDTVLLSFYKQVDPPGFWKKSAKKSSMDPNHAIESFKTGAYLTVTTSLSVYLLLVGFGKLIFPNPESPIAYAWIYIILGIASIPLWWKRFFHNGFFGGNETK
jgi:SSS family solute:Na+ symporter